ncbi:(2Fe-2S) ferredoxin domain-containing protein [Alkaliphilus hydrothermalis]|uniref:NADP-reducing hydrogenase subunit HndB n=1 Tax=Alkaliphilus hydrothermalis TaxID=1482730 RepID=A0ABS2NSZ3_9FIRM|nr:(2Fe-2S) ferredoxin domain-containing protein [Alkaliphilus hydrothermalis]MBM7615887.1 NADP-reducing hydrogenase subunit HndB [Alkaliphilus hydrothermalis]
MSYNEFYDNLRISAEENIQKKRNGKIRVVLGYGVCSISVGASEVLKAMQEVIADGEINNVVIETTGCAGLCAKEPMLDIYTPDGKRFTYEYVTADKAKAIVVSHAILEEEIKKWLLKM